MCCATEGQSSCPRRMYAAPGPVMRSPARSSRRSCEDAVGMRARTPYVRLQLPAACLEQLARIERLRRDADHRLAEAGGHAGKDVCVLIVRRRLDDRLRAALGVARLEDARADEEAVCAELHAERCVGGRCG